jgi:DNA-binding MarR family transcriptional regulator
MALKGNLRDFSTTQLLNLIHLARKTGALTIQVPAGVTTLFFREGKLVQATTGGRDGHLASVLARAGKLTEEQAKIIRSRSGNKTDKELGMLLINAGHVTQKDIVNSIRNDVLETVYGLFTWSDGMFHFEPNQLPSDDAITVPIDLENIILEGSRRVKEWERLQDELPDLNMALRFTDRPQAQLRNINLSVDEWRVISYINPRNSIKQIAQRIGMDDFQIRKIIYGLLQAGLVEMLEPEGARRTPTAAQLRAQETVMSRPPAVKRSVIRKLIDRIKRL